jgi:predicted RNA methylase
LKQQLIKRFLATGMMSFGLMFVSTKTILADENDPQLQETTAEDVKEAVEEAQHSEMVAGLESATVIFDDPETTATVS